MPGHGEVSGGRYGGKHWWPRTGDKRVEEDEANARAPPTAVAREFGDQGTATNAGVSSARERAAQAATREAKGSDSRGGKTLASVAAGDIVEAAAG